MYIHINLNGRIASGIVSIEETTDAWLSVFDRFFILDTL